MTNKAVLDYTKRPLNDGEREFASLPENHDLIFEYMNYRILYNLFLIFSSDFAPPKLKG